MDEEKEDDTLSMDQTVNPALVDEPRIDHELKDEPEPEKTDQPRGPDGKFASKETGEKPAEEAAVATPADNPIPDDQFKGYLTEKRKRQELEQTVADMQRRLDTFQQQQPQAPEPDFWDNPRGTISSEVQRAVQEAMRAQQQQQTAERIDASEAAARSKYADYDDAFHAFRQAAQTNPTLVQKMTQSSDPAEFAYSTGKRALDLERVGSIDELLKAERAKWEAEAKAAMPAPQPSFPQSTVQDGSAAPRGGPVWSGPVSDRDILPMG